MQQNDNDERIMRQNMIMSNATQKVVMNETGYPGIDARRAAAELFKASTHHQLVVSDVLTNSPHIIEQS